MTLTDHSLFVIQALAGVLALIPIFFYILRPVYKVTKRVQIPTSFKDENAKGLVDLLNSLSSPDVKIRINAVMPSCDGCGAQTVERFDSIKEARKEILKLG